VPPDWAAEWRLNMETYKLKIEGLERDLPICKVSDELCIAAFVIFGDVELTVACAKGLLKLAPEFDVLITAEAKGIPLVYEMSRSAGINKYIVARKHPKLYMKDVVEAKVKSITTANEQALYLDKAEADYICGKKVLMVDDVISTGESLFAVEHLVKNAGGIIVGKMAALAEGAAQNRDDITYLEKLPLFNSDGTLK